MEQEIFSSEQIKITKKDNDYYIESYKKGLSFEELKGILADISYINITNFMAVRNAIQNAPLPKVKFAELKERIHVEINADELKAYITLSVLDIELAGEARARLVREILDTLTKLEVIYGINHSELLGSLVNGKKILIAEGDASESGQDSIVKKYELNEVKPEIKEDGKADHYELNLINKVQKGDWLGEQTDPTEGVPGKTIKGKIIAPMPGKPYHWQYDKSSVEEVKEEGKTILRALRSGAVHYDGERILVSNHLEVEGDVDFKTGNINFDGFITIKGSVADNFSINADKDIEIKGDYGVGGVKEVRSRLGNVYIKGGIAGKGKAVIRSEKNIFTKFISDATVYCEGSVHIGFYCLNSNITAKEIILDSPKGQIIGGNINAEIKVVSSTIGSIAEKRTVVSVTGFDRNALKIRYDDVEGKIQALKNELYKVKQEVIIYASIPQTALSKKQANAYTSANENYAQLKGELIKLEIERKTLAGYLKSHGEGEIAILKKVYPNTFMEIKKLTREINRETIGTVFYYSDGEIKQL